MEVYLDHAATAKILPEVLDQMNEAYLNYYANPSALHQAGNMARERIEDARKLITSLIRVSPDELIFTSGGTESNNTVVTGVADWGQQQQRRQWLLSAIEHPSVMQPYNQLKNKGSQVNVIPAGRDGRISLEALESLVNEDTKLVSVMHVNNETGIIQPVEEAIKLVKQKNRNTLFHIDGVQAFGKVPLDLSRLQPDFYSLSAHKIGGPRGVGALFMKKPVRSAPLLQGGGQERQHRSGTENTAGIIGFETAASIRLGRMQQNNSAIWNMRKYLISQMKRLLDDLLLIESPDPVNQVPGILMVACQGIKSEVILRMLSDEQIYLSAGSACSSKKTAASHVLQAMKLPAAWIDGVLRISFDETLTTEQADRFIERLAYHVRQMRKVMKR